jgi:hypothetical protein
MKRLGILWLVGATVLGLVGAAHAQPDKPDKPDKADKPDKPNKPGRPELANSGMMHAHPAPSGSAFPGPGFRGGQADIAEAFRKHRPSQEELKSAMAAAHENAKVRREARMLEVRQRFGADVLARREVFEELRVHARRMAFLNRAKLVATTELEEPKRTKALARIDKLTAIEQSRHQARIAKLREASSADAGGTARLASSVMPPAPSGSGAMVPAKPHGPPLGTPGVPRPPAAKGSAP